MTLEHPRENSITLVENIDILKDLTFEEEDLFLNCESSFQTSFLVVAWLTLKRKKKRLLTFSNIQIPFQNF